jgi:anti-anti-sigma regulatory factor
MEMIQPGNLLYLTGEGHSEVLAGVYYNGIVYYDFTNVHYINNSGVADLIDLVKTWIDMGTEVRFINVNRDIRNRFKDIDIDHVLTCE